MAKEFVWLTPLQKARRKVSKLADERAEACWNQEAKKSVTLRRRFERALDDYIAEAQAASVAEHTAGKNQKDSSP